LCGDPGEGINWPGANDEFAATIRHGAHRIQHRREDAGVAVSTRGTTRPSAGHV